MTCLSYFIGNDTGCVYAFDGFKVYGYTAIFSLCFQRETTCRDFQFAYLENEVFPKRGLLLRKEFAPMGGNSFRYERIPNYMGDNNECDMNLTELFPLKVYPFFLTDLP